MPRANTLPQPVPIGQAAEALLKGGIVAYPTEAVWGLGCDPFNEKAVQELLQLKNRPVSKGLILVAESLEQIRPYLDDNLPPDKLEQLTTPGEVPVTWLVPCRHSALPGWITGDSSRLAVRISQHPVVRALCRAAQIPIVSTSANRSGDAPATTLSQVQACFGDKVIICQGETGTANRPSTIRDLLTGDVIRK